MGFLALGLQRGQQGVSEGTPLSRQRWLRHSFPLPSPAAASPQRPPPGHRASRALLVPKKPPYPAAPRNAKGCSFPQRLRAAAARLGGGCARWGRSPLPRAAAAGSVPHKLRGAVGSGRHGWDHPESRQLWCHCLARSPRCDSASGRGFGGTASPSVTPQAQKPL